MVVCRVLFQRSPDHAHVQEFVANETRRTPPETCQTYGPKAFSSNRLDRVLDGTEEQSALG